MHLRIIILFFVLQRFSVFADDTISFASIDKWSYIAYTQNNLKETNRISKAAFDHDIDYYYLRMRVGIVNYNHQRFSNAINHFEKALSFNSADTLALEYLYYCHVNMGNKIAANSIAKEFPEHKRVQLNLGKPVFVEYAFMAGSYLFNNTIDEQIKETEKLPAMPYYRDLNKNLTSSSFGLIHNLSRTITYTHSFTKLNANQYMHPFIISNNYFQTSIAQKQYYGRFYVHLSDQLSIQAGIHLLATTYDVYSLNSKTYELTKTKKDTASKLLFYGVRYKLNNLELFAFNGFSNFNKNKQVQVNAGGLIYPLGTRTFFSETELTGIFSDSALYSIKQTLGVKIPRTGIWLSGTLSAGKKNNYSDMNGSVIYNNNSTALFQTGATLAIPLFHNKMHINISWLYETKKGTSLYSIDNRVLKIPNFNPTNINTQTITGGLTWKL